MKTEVEPLATGPSSTAAHHPTTVGNYFVSNYPPFSLQRPPQPETPLGIYLHIPFCRKRCHFCYFRVYTDKDSAAIRAYIEAALKELTVYARQPVIERRKPAFFYLVGVTPSFIS
jgi:oxygen-independent coproporphyrinogen-3 oxidase